eukprot:866724-Amorphochlora_amoeboformis.AAC.1
MGKIRTFSGQYIPPSSYVFSPFNKGSSSFQDRPSKAIRGMYTGKADRFPANCRRNHRVPAPNPGHSQRTHQAH